MMYSVAIMTLLAGVFAYVAAQTVYIDIDTGKIVGIEPGKSNQGNRVGNPHRNQDRQRSQQSYPNYQPTYPNQQRPNYQPQQPWYQPQPPRQENQANNLNTEWVCRDPKTGNTMIIASEGGTIKGMVPNQQNPYQDNPWLPKLNPHVPQQNLQDPQNNWNQLGQGMPDVNAEPTLPAIILTTTPIPPTTPPPPPTSNTKPPFPTLDIDWTQYLDKTTKKPSADALSAALDGEGILEPRGGRR